ncbi:sensor histidine kinase [Streptomyces puniciscabiei]
MAEVLEAHRRRALRLKVTLRVIVAFSLIAALGAWPPRTHPLAVTAIAVAYGVVSVSLLILALRGHLFPVWAVLALDLTALTALLALSGVFSERRWSSPFVGDIYVLIPILAAFQLSLKITALSGAAATVVYAIASWIGHTRLGAELHFSLVHALLVAIVTVACSMLSWVQHSRVVMIANLAQQRSRLLSQSMSTEDRERRALAEALHDGPLQSVLAARQDIDELRESRQHQALERADMALCDASRQLRSSVTQLYPEVLERAGLGQALQDLAAQAGRRGSFAVRVEYDTPTVGHAADRLLYHCARELFTNIIKHARAQNVTVHLALRQSQALLEIADDGVGLQPDVLERSVAEGHIGLGSQLIRMQEAGGTLTLRNNIPRGTVAVVTVPADAAFPERASRTTTT